MTFANVYEDDRLVRVTAGDEVFASYTYDARGRLTELASSQGTVRRSYDDLGRVSSIEDGGLEWKVLEFSAAGRPKKIDTPYGMVAITYGEDGRPDRTEVSGYGRTDSRDRITTSYDWRAEGDRETARVTRGGYVSTLAFEDGVLTSARTPLGHWGYSYSKEFPGRLSGVSGPNGTASYSYEDAGGSPRLTEAKVGNSARTFTWDDLGRLTAIGGAEERSFEYRKDGITEGGAQGRKVTWNEAGLPETVESNGSTEVWAWNPDRTLKSITSRAGLFGDDVVWNAAYDDQKRLTGLDRQGSADDVSVAWGGSSGEPTHPVRIAVGGSGPALELKWTVPGELRSATLGDQAWKVGRDSFRNVSKVTRSGESAGTISTSWDDGLPVGVKSNEGSLTLEQCSEFDCEVELNIGGATTKLDYSKGSVDTLAAGRKTVFTRNDDGLVTKGCQNVNGENECTRWPVEGESDLARFDELFGGTDGQLRGLASRPLPPDPPAIASLPTEFRPAGLDIELPDEALDAAIAEAVPALPQTYRLGEDGAVVRLGNRLAPTTISIAYGPGVSVPVSVFGDATLGALDSPLGEGGQLASLAGALEGIESDSVARPATDLALRAVEYLPNVLGLAAEFLGSLFVGPIAGAALLAVAAGVCAVGSASCAALAVAGALMLVPGGLGVVVSLLLRETLTAVLDGALAIARGVSWQDAAIAAGAAILIGLVAQNAKPVKRLCGAKRVWCLDASNSPEAAANAVEARGQRWGVLRVDRANVTARRREALSATPRKSGFDRDEFPPAATRQGGAGARVAYIDPGDNRRAGASLGNAIKDLDDGQRFVYLVVDSSDRPFTLLDSLGAGRAISATGPAN